MKNAIVKLVSVDGHTANLKINGVPCHCHIATYKLIKEQGLNTTLLSLIKVKQ